MELQANIFKYPRLTLKTIAMPVVIAILLLQYVATSAEIFTGLRSAPSIGTITNALFTVGINGNSEQLVGGPAPVVTTQLPGQPDTTHLVLNGNVTNLGFATTTSAFFQWGYTPAYGNTTPQQTKSSTGAFTAALSGLDVYNTVYYRAVTLNGTIYSYGSQQSIQLDPPAQASASSAKTIISAAFAVAIVIIIILVGLYAGGMQAAFVGVILFLMFAIVLGILQVLS
jgi:hypothetical protein